MYTAHMLKRTFVLLCGAVAFASCLKDSSQDDTYNFIKEADTEGIELFMRSYKVVNDGEFPELVKTDLDDPQNMWNTRRTQEVTDNVPYDNLIGHAFADTAIVKLVTGAGDTVDVASGVWVYVNKRGVTTERPVDSCSVLMTYTGLLLNDNVFEIAPAPRELYLYDNTILGLRLGMKYFEPGHLVTETITPEPNEDGTQDPPYEKDVWKDGGQGWIMIPSRVAYGNILSSSVPPNSVLIFLVDLYSIAKYPVVETGDAKIIQLGGKGQNELWLNTPPADKTIKLKK